MSEIMQSKSRCRQSEEADCSPKNQRRTSQFYADARFKASDPYRRVLFNGHRTSRPSKGARVREWGVAGTGSAKCSLEEPTLGTDFRHPEHPVSHKSTVCGCSSVVIVLIRQFKNNGELLRLPSPRPTQGVLYRPCLASASSSHRPTSPVARPQS
jgi:hypothetical protein